MSAPAIPGLTSWIAWDPTGEPDHARWLQRLQQAFDEVRMTSSVVIATANAS